MKLENVFVTKALKGFCSFVPICKNSPLWAPPFEMHFFRDIFAKQTLNLVPLNQFSKLLKFSRWFPKRKSSFSPIEFESSEDAHHKNSLQLTYPQHCLCQFIELSVEFSWILNPTHFPRVIANEWRRPECIGKLVTLFHFNFLAVKYDKLSIKCRH